MYGVGIDFWDQDWYTVQVCKDNIVNMSLNKHKVHSI